MLYSDEGMGSLESKIEFTVDECGRFSGEPLDKNIKQEEWDCLIEEIRSLDCSMDEDQIKSYKIDTKYQCDLKIEYYKTWTDCGYEYDATVTIENEKEIK